MTDSPRREGGARVVSIALGSWAPVVAYAGKANDPAGVAAGSVGGFLGALMAGGAVRPSGIGPGGGS